jgi:hypothetical protein
MGKSKAPPAPDYSEIAAATEKAAELQYELGKEQLAWAKETYKTDKVTYDKIVNGFLADMDETSAAAAEDRAFYKQNFQPLEQALAEEAKTYDTTERREREMGAAQAGIAQQFDAQRENAQRELEAYGIDPSSTRYGALDIGMRATQAAAQAAAGTAANNRVEDVSRALRSEAINVGRGYPGQVASSYATASQAGGGAGQLTGQATSVGGQTMGTAPQYFGGANQSLNTWGNTLNMQYNNQLDRWKANQQASSGWGSALGLIGGIAGKAFGLADGGAVPDPRDVGAIPEELSPSGGAATDDVNANLNVGEFVIPEDVVSWYGEKHMYSLIEKANKEREQAKQTTGAVPDVSPALPGAPVLQTA